MSATTLSILGIVVLVILLFLGINIGLGMMIVGFIGYVLAVNWGAAIGQIKLVPFTIASNYSFCVIPLFIIMGNFAYASGISDGLFNVGDKFLSRFHGGLGWATIAACALFGAICGSTAATAATMGVIAVPAMRKYGYDDGLACGTISIGGTLGIMIPPSTPFIVYGIMAEQSIGRLFAAGVLPGIMLAVLCCITINIVVRRNPSLAPDVNVRYTTKEKLSSLKEALEFLLLGENDSTLKEGVIEDICSQIIAELRAQELTDSSSDYLEDHAFEVQERITSRSIRAMHIMEG